MGPLALPPLNPRARTRTLRPFGTYIDWLTVNATGPVSLWQIVAARPWRISDRRMDDRALWLQPTEHSTKHFKKVFYLVDGAGTKLVTFCAVPHSEALHPPDAVQVQFENATLYTDLWFTLWQMLRRAGFQYKGVSKLDLAADGIAGAGGDYQDVVSDALFVRGGKYYGKAGWSPRFVRSKVTAFELGTRASDKFLRCYCKTRELKTRGRDKPHIRDAWAARLGYDPIREGVTVNRFELSVKGKELRDHYLPHVGGDVVGMWPMVGIDQQVELTEVRGYPIRERCGGILEDIRQPAHRADILRSLTSKLFDFRTEAVRARNARPLAVWDWTACTETGMDGAFERKPKTVTLSPHTIKTTLRTLYLLHLATGDVSYLKNCMQIAHGAGNHMAGWWQLAKERWVKEHANLRQRRKDGLDVGLFDQFEL